LAVFVAIPLGILLALSAHGVVAHAAAIAFAVSVVAMFGVGSLFHRISWTPAGALRMGRLDHAMIYALIAGTYAPIGLLVVHPAWRVPLLAVAWGGALIATMAKLAWRNAPIWIAPVVCVALGWLVVVALPQVVDGIGISGSLLLVGGGLAYTAGAVVYARRRPDPIPHLFGYHELFHVLVLVAVACQYAAVAFFVLPRA
jgi:hemolysin III